MKASESVVFIIDDDPAVRDSLRLLVKRLGLRIQTFPSAEEFIEKQPPDVAGCLVLDMRMSGMTGLELQDEMIRRGFSLPIIFITGYGDVPTAVRATQKGAVDFIEKPFDHEVLLARIQDAVEQDEKNRRLRAENAEIAVRIESLSPREQEVMDLVISGMTSREIAQRLCRSEKTIKAHRLHLMKKLKAHTSAELVRMALTVRMASERLLQPVVAV